MSFLGTEQRTPDAALRRFGWEQPPGRRNLFVLRRTSGPLEIRRCHLDRSWMQFEVESPAFGSQGESLLYANGTIPGPWKHVPGGHASVVLRADFPRHLLIEDEDFSALLPQSRPLSEIWADDLSTFLVDGALPPAPVDPPVANSAEIAKYLEGEGWAAAADGDTTRVMIALPFVCRQAVVDHLAAAGPWIATDMLDLTGWPAVCRRAALELAQSANSRLPLVRFSASALDQTEKLRAEVRLGNVPRLPGVWLLTALSALQAAVALCARELAALQEPELAQIVTAGKSAEEGGRS